MRRKIKTIMSKNVKMNKNMAKRLNKMTAEERCQLEQHAEEIAARVDVLECELNVAMLRHARGKDAHIVALMALAAVVAQAVTTMEECGIKDAEKTFDELKEEEKLNINHC